MVKGRNNPNVHQWMNGINKMWYIHTVEYYSALIRKLILIYDAIWMNLDDIMLSKISQSQKDRLCDCTHMKYPEESNSQRLARN